MEMSAAQEIKKPDAKSDPLAHMMLMREIEDFLYLEADVLDSRDWERWLTFFSDDLKYWMPIRKNLAYRERNDDITDETEAAWFDNNKDLLERRVRQIMTGIHWAEEPLSRVTHLLTNIRLLTPVSSVAEGETILVRSNFMVYRNRLETEVDIMVGRRDDTLRRVKESFQIKTRKVLLDQNVLLAKNLSFFF
jgi:3-phenylpropionate/cinnamic acid dioxygenase small subunit